MRIRSKRDMPYQGKVSLAPGEAKDIEDGEAKRLLVTFPDWFEAVEAEVAAAPDVAESEADTAHAKAPKRPPRSKPYKPRTK